MLDASDKSYYKAKLTESRQNYDSMKKQYLAAKERFEVQAARENINFSTAEVSNEFIN